VIDSETLGVETILDREKISTIVDIIRWLLEIWSTFDGTIGHIQKVCLIGQLNNLSIVIHNLFWIFFVIFSLNHTTKDHDLLACHLSCTSMNDSQLDVIGDEIDCFP
jgi:hypothetical protein